MRPTKDLIELAVNEAKLPSKWRHPIKRRRERRALMASIDYVYDFIDRQLGDREHFPTMTELELTYGSRAVNVAWNKMIDDQEAAENDKP